MKSINKIILLKCGSIAHYVFIIAPVLLTIVASKFSLRATCIFFGITLYILSDMLFFHNLNEKEEINAIFI